MEGGLSIDEKVIIIDETSTKYFVASVTHTDGENCKQINRGVLELWECTFLKER